MMCQILTLHIEKELKRKLFYPHISGFLSNFLLQSSFGFVCLEGASFKVEQSFIYLFLYSFPMGVIFPMVVVRTCHIIKFL